MVTIGLLPHMVINNISDLFEMKNVTNGGNKKQITSGGNKILLPPEVTNIFEKTLKRKCYYGW